MTIIVLVTKNIKIQQKIPSSFKAQADIKASQKMTTSKSTIIKEPQTQSKILVGKVTGGLKSLTVSEFKKVISL